MSIKKEHVYFIKTIAIASVALLVLSSILFWLISGGLEKLNPNLPFFIFILIISIFFLFIAIFIISLIYNDNKNKLFFVNFTRYVLIKILYPAAVLISSIFRIDRNKMQRSFIAINNSLLFSIGKQVPHNRILILLPHCLQLHNCKAKITEDIHNCLDCGKCNIKELNILGDKNGIDIAVATGGTLARRVLEEKKPKIVIAVACERDLSSGILDAFPLPVYGLINIRPNGPCRDTQVDVTALNILIEKITA